MTNKEAIKMLKSKMDGHTDTSYEWAETVRMAIKALEQQPCEDCISRRNAIDAFESCIHELGIDDDPYNYGEMVLGVANLPCVIPKEKTGKWDVMSGEIFKCSECKQFSDKVTDFCPNCGAKMVEPQESEEI